MSTDLEFFHGLIDEVAYYNKMISVDSIVDVFQTSLTSFLLFGCISSPSPSPTPGPSPDSPSTSSSPPPPPPDLPVCEPIPPMVVNAADLDGQGNKKKQISLLSKSLSTYKYKQIESISFIMTYMSIL